MVAISTCPKILQVKFLAKENRLRMASNKTKIPGKMRRIASAEAGNIRRKPLWMRIEKRWSGVAMNECATKNSEKDLLLDHQPSPRTLWKVMISKLPKKGHCKPLRLETWNKEPSSCESKVGVDATPPPRKSETLNKVQGGNKKSHEITPSWLKLRQGTPISLITSVSFSWTSPQQSPQLWNERRSIKKKTKHAMLK